MLAQAVAGSLDLDDDGVVQEAVEQRGGDNGIAEDVTPLGEAAVRGQDHGAALVAGVDELEEQIAAAGDDREIADLVDDEQARPAEEADALLQASFALGTGERRDEVGESREVDALACLHGLDAESRRKVALAGSRRSEEMDDFGAFDEAELGEREDPVAIERGLGRAGADDWVRRDAGCVPPALDGPR